MNVRSSDCWCVRHIVVLGTPKDRLTVLNGTVAYVRPFVDCRKYEDSGSGAREIYVGITY